MKKKMDATKVLLGLGLAVVSFATGCGSVGAKEVTFRSAANEPTTVIHHAVKDTASVEVLLDSAPERPFVEAGELSTNTLSNTASIEAMRQKAAEAGLDGIYWIDCTSACSGKCTAKGFKYTDAARNVASR